MAGAFASAISFQNKRHALPRTADPGHRAVMLFLLQIGSAQRFKLARDIDPAYGRAFDLARAGGVEAFARRCRLTHDGIEVAEAISIVE